MAGDREDGHTEGQAAALMGVITSLITGFLNDPPMMLFAIVALLVGIAAFERSFIVWQAKKKRERQNRSRPDDV